MLQSKLDKDIVLELFRAEELQQIKEEQSLNRAAAAAALVLKGKGGPRGNGRSEGQCFNCGDKGHWANRCPHPKKSIQANKAQAEAEEVVENAGCASAFALDQLTNSFSDIVLWNTDTGATSHMINMKASIASVSGGLCRCHILYYTKCTTHHHVHMSSFGLLRIQFSSVRSKMVHRDSSSVPLFTLLYTLYIVR